MPKEPKPNFASFTKAELVKTVKKLDARQTKLLNEIAQLKVLVAKNGLAAADTAAEHADLTEANMLRLAEEHFGDAGVVHVTQAPAEDWRHKGEVAAGKPAFPWEKD